MNQKAAELGMTHTHYANPHGLEEEGHYSSAADLATMGRYALEHYPFIRETVTTLSINIVAGGTSHSRLDRPSHGLLRGPSRHQDRQHREGRVVPRRGPARSRDALQLRRCAATRARDAQPIYDLARLGLLSYHERTLCVPLSGSLVAIWQDGFWLRCPVNP